MKNLRMRLLMLVVAGMCGGLSAGWAAKDGAVVLSDGGKVLEARYSAMLEGLKKEVAGALPVVSREKQAALEKAGEDFRKAEAEAAAAQDLLGKVNGAKGLVEHAKGKWIGGAEREIAAAEEALKKAKTDAEREAVRKELAKWQANKEDGLKALKERQAAYDQAKAEEPKWLKAHEAAQGALERARAGERAAANAVLAELATVLGTDRLDAKLVKCVVLTVATPRGLAEFAEQGKAEEAMVERLLGDVGLMREMLIAGGARFGKYGEAMRIYAGIQKATDRAREGALQRLALATSLEHATPIEQTAAAEQKGSAAAVVDPVKRYLHYEKAFLAGELDPAFKGFTTWEYRMVVNCDAPDEILAWGREMLRTYRPDHVSMPDYGWRYVSAVRTEVPYGSQNVKDDLPSLHQYQNIIMNGGVCGRRAFFGRFILRSFGIPTWGVTQHKHAALSHWTPKGWVVNLGAGFQASWWDKEDVPMSGTQFLLETQARKHEREFMRVLRAQWVSRIVGEAGYNERRKIAGGLWSRMAHFQSVVLSEKEVVLGPLGQELAEANEKEQKVASAPVSDGDRKVEVRQDGGLVIPAVAHGKAEGKASAMRGVSGGMQLHCLGGFKAPYEIDVPRGGKYVLTVRVATVQTGQKVRIKAGAQEPTEMAVPYTKGLWQETEGVEVLLEEGKQVLDFELLAGSRGVSVKDFTLVPVR
jgi:hypothetical protein